MENIPFLSNLPNVIEYLKTSKDSVCFVKATLVWFKMNSSWDQFCFQLFEVTLLQPVLSHYQKKILLFLKAPSYITQLAFTKKSWATPSWKFKPVYLHLKVNWSCNSPCSASWFLKGERKEYYFSYQSFTAFCHCNIRKTKKLAAIRKQT